MKKLIVEVDVNTKQAVNSIEDLENVIGNLQEKLKKEKIGSDEFNRLSKELIKAQKELKNTELALEALDSEQVASELGSVTGAVGDITAAFVLLGGDDGALSETAERIEKAIGISMAFKGAIEGVQSGMKLFNNIVKTSTFLQKANNTINLTATAIMKAFGGSVNTTSLAFKGLRGAIIATGIGALVVLVGELVANFDKIKESVNGVSKATRDLVTSTQQRADLAEENLTTLQNQENILKLQGKTEREILQMKINAQKKVIKGIEANIAATKIENQERIEGSKRNKELLVKTAEILFVIPRTLIKGIDLLGQGLGTIINKVTQNKFAQKLFGLEPVNIDLGFSEDIDDFIDFAASIVFDPDKAQDDADEQMKILEENLLKQKNALAGFQLGLIDMDAKAAEVIKKQKKDAVDEEILQIKKIEAATIDLNKKKVDSTKSAYVTMGNIVKQHYEKLEEERQARLERVNEEIELTQRGLEAVQALGDAVFAHKMKNLDKESKEGQKVAEKQFKFNKALQLGLAVVDGAKAVTASLAAAPVAILGLPNPAGIASLAFAITTSAAQIATIAAQKFQPSLSSASSPSASSPSGVSESQAPQFNIVGDSAFNQIAGALNQPIQAFVVAQDVTTAQQLDNGIITSATLGGG